MIKSERETCQLGHLFQGADSSSWVRHFDWLTLVMSARVKVAVNLSLSYGFNQNFDEGLGTVHNPCPSLSCLKSIFLDPGHRDIYCTDFLITFRLWATVGLKPGQPIILKLIRLRNKESMMKNMWIFNVLLKPKPGNIYKKRPMICVSEYVFKWLTVNVYWTETPF